MVETKKKKGPVGRPTKYRPEYCQEIIEHFDIPLYKTVEVEKMSASGVVKTLTEQRPNDFPTLYSFCRKIGVSADVLADWGREHPEFLRSLNICKGIQAEFLTKHGLSGGYVSSFAKFIAVNVTDYVDKSEVRTENDHNVKGYGLAFNLDDKPQE